MVWSINGSRKRITRGSRKPSPPALASQFLTTATMVPDPLEKMIWQPRSIGVAGLRKRTSWPTCIRRDATHCDPLLLPSRSKRVGRFELPHCSCAPPVVLFSSIPSAWRMHLEIVSVGLLSEPWTLGGSEKCVPSGTPVRCAWTELTGHRWLSNRPPNAPAANCGIEFTNAVVDPQSRSSERLFRRPQCVPSEQMSIVVVCRIQIGWDPSEGLGRARGGRLRTKVASLLWKVRSLTHAQLSGPYCSIVVVLSMIHASARGRAAGHPVLTDSGLSSRLSSKGFWSSAER